MGNQTKTIEAREEPLDSARKLVDAAEPLDALTKQLVDSAEKHINGLIREAGSKYEDISDYIVDKVFVGDTLSALTPGKSSPVAFTELLRRCDDTLDLPRPKVLQATRIGALNRHLAGTPWKGLSWSVKQELLPLVGADGNLTALKDGSKFASKGLGMRAVRDWVASKLAGNAAETEPAETTAPTIASSRKAFEVANRFAKAPDRRRWLDRAEKLPEDERDALLTSLRSATKQLAKLLSDFESALQEA
jgi:hypothetical protein